VMLDILDDFSKHFTFDFEKIIIQNEKAEQTEALNQLQDEPQKPGEICKFFLKGSCMKGNSCQFRHSKNERAVVCKHWLRGLCKKGDLCEFLHEYDMSKMPECYFFSKFGECSNNECTYLHIPPEDKLRDCPWYDRGFCKHGPRCRQKHVKKAACENYLLGFCPDGPKCKYGHPKYELPKEDDNPMRKPRTPMICHKCGSIGHKAISCPNSGAAPAYRELPERPNSSRTLDKVVCFKCGQMGHYANLCPNKKIPPPPGGYAIPDLPNGQPGGFEFPPGGGAENNPRPPYQNQGYQQHYYPPGGRGGGGAGYSNQIPVWNGA